MNENAQLSIPSSIDQIQKVECFIEQLRKEWALSETIYANAMITVTEAVNNAIKHGNQLDPDKEVQINALCTEEELVFKIQDEGSGFNPDTLPNPLEEENLLKDSGRGVFIIRQMADKVAFNEAGNAITITFMRNAT